MFEDGFIYVVIGGLIDAFLIFGILYMFFNFGV